MFMINRYISSRYLNRFNTLRVFWFFIKLRELLALLFTQYLMYSYLNPVDFFLFLFPV
jgi:hypothetical protein